MNLSRFLLGASRWRVALIAGMGVLAGVCGAGFIAVINRVLHAPAIGWRLPAAFLGLLLGKAVSQGLAQLLLARFTQDATLALQQRLARQVVATPFRRLEQFGTARILGTLTDDVAVLALALQSIPTVLTNLAVLAGCAVYLAWLSHLLFLGVLAVVLLGACMYWVLLTQANRAFGQMRQVRNRLFRHIRALTDGLKELMLHRARREAFLAGHLDRTAAALRDQNIAVTRLYLLADSSSQLLFYGLVGILLFAIPLFKGLSPAALTGYVFAALYVMNPIWAIIGTLPTISRGGASLANIEELGLSLAPAEGAPGRPAGQPAVWHSLAFEGVTFAYPVPDGRDRSFVLGPLSLRFRPGELVFVVGGNGSGKTTFVKLLTGLYQPTAGAIRLDGRAIDPQDLEAYRARFAVVFSDFYLFEELLGLEQPDLDALARIYLERLKLTHKVHIEGGRLSTTALSQGQRKRLALLTAYLEDRPIYVFDEWAADQDPDYKEIFYKQLLPDLRARGKTVVVITHDDRYFHLGDRVLRLEDGHLAGGSGPAGDAAGREDRLQAAGTPVA